MPVLRTDSEVRVEDVHRVLSDALGPSYRVTVMSPTMVKVGRAGVIPSQVEISRSGGMTTFKVHTTGLIVSRLVQVCSVNPRVRRALQEGFPRVA